MCGLSGIINFKSSPSIKIVTNMNNRIRYRGPDHQDVWKNEYASFGVVRLKIIDLSEASNQPFFDKEKKITIIYNGEIYNFKELKNQFFSNQIFFSNGDGEILLYLYKKFGIEFINKIKGMYSIAICDENLKKIFLIRDRFGIKPLYFNLNENDNELSFCSEIPGLLENSKIIKKPNYSEIYRYLQNSMVNSTDQTWFEIFIK